jgi:hypothetical protein
LASTRSAPAANAKIRHQKGDKVSFPIRCARSPHPLDGGSAAMQPLIRWATAATAASGSPHREAQRRRPSSRRFKASMRSGDDSLRMTPSSSPCNVLITCIIRSISLSNRKPSVTCRCWGAWPASHVRSPVRPARAPVSLHPEGPPCGCQLQRTSTTFDKPRTCVVPWTRCLRGIARRPAMHWLLSVRTSTFLATD